MRKRNFRLQQHALGRIVALKDDEKAQTTINTFNLNAKHLVGARREAMEVVRYFIEDYERTERELRVEWKNDEEVDEYLREILENFLTQNNESDFFRRFIVASGDDYKVKQYRLVV